MKEIELQTVLAPSEVFSLHQFIFDKEISRIFNFIASNPFEKIVISDGDSAIAWSLKCGDLDIYEVLVANGFKLAVDEDFAVILNELDDNPKVKSARKLKLREIHRKYMKESTKKHLFKLNLMTKLAPKTLEEDRPKFEGIIAATFEELAKNPKNETIMKYVASAEGESGIIEVFYRSS
jgi:hypothetical protein